MPIDPDNPVARLCAEGIQAEASGKAIAAMRLYMQAWEKRSDDLDACIAAHYVARLQKTPEEILEWNQRSLDAANALDDEDVASFYPSLYLNMGKAHEELGQRDEARHYYQLAAEKLGFLPQGDYAEVVKTGVANALKRIG
ncbi:MAG TPA: hypothetical protein VMB47_16145 [Candidatus Aquilonibacter sp.]|nr:hypothetical protein [Candidatus Aquilonibacter sp.]